MRQPDIEAAFRDHRPLVVASAQRILRSREDAEDVAQEIFAGLWAHPERYERGRGDLTSYLALTTRHRCLDLLRRRASRQRTCEALASEAATRGLASHEDLLAATLRRERARAIRMLLLRLSPAQREALILKHWAGLTDVAIARQTRAAVGTVKGRLRHGGAALRARSAAL